MARTFTADERAAIASQHHDIYGKLEIEDPDGNYVDVSTDLDDPDWFNKAVLEEDIDGNAMMLSAELLRDTGTESLLSLAPLREDSTINRDGGAAYAPMLDLARKWRLSVAVVEHGASPAAAYKAIGEGLIDDVDVRHPENIIRVTGRCLMASVLDTWIDTVRTYSGAMETVIQTMLDDNGLSGITLYTPVSPSFVMNEWDQQPESLGVAIAKVAAKAGFVCRFRYDSADTFRLTLYEPDRAASSEVWELGPTEYTEQPMGRMNISGVRNRIILRYFETASGSVQTHTESDATSIARYGGPHAIPRKLEIDLAQETNINTAARANSLAEDILSDLKNPAHMQQFATPGFWIAQLHDYGKFLANAVHSDQDQYGGVTRIRHELTRGTLRTSLFTRGQPSGGYKRWIRDTSARPPAAIPLIARAKIQTTSATQVVVRCYVADPFLRPQERFGRILSAGQGPVSVAYSGDGVGTISPASPQSIAAASITTDPATTGYVEITVNRPAYLAGTGRLIMTASRVGRANATDAIDIPALEQNNPGSLVVETDAEDVIINLAGPDTCNSWKYAVSTSAMPSDADVNAGTTENNRVARITKTNVVPNLGDRYYVKARPFTGASAGGTGGPYITAEVERQNKVTTKTLRFPHTFFVPQSETSDIHRASSGTRPGSKTSLDLYGGIVLPVGAEMVAFRTRSRRTNGDGSIDLTLKSVSDSEVITDIATQSHSATGYQTISTAISETVPGNVFYIVNVLIDSTAATNATDNALLWVEIDYDVPDLETTY